MIGAEGTRLLREKRVQGRTRRRSRGQTAAEIESLERKSTVNL
ncbi:hypothetical protein RCO48_00560 [Peribacillus frigoritolerans]|nr:hypothetical protein [Peribacillus frigoritolerans]